MKKLSILLVLLVASFSAQADDSAKRETVERILELTNVEAMIDSMYSQVDKMFVDMARQMGVKESEQPVFDRYMLRVVAAMKEDMTWQRMKGPMVDIYIKHYTEKELEDLLAFYSTDSGRAMIKKMPLVMQESMLISQTMFTDFMPRLKELSRELREELKVARSTN